MTLESQHGIVAHHAASVIGDLDDLLAARFDVNTNARGSGVQGVFEQLFHHRSRTLHHFARSNLIGNAFGEDVNLAHWKSVISGWWLV